MVEYSLTESALAPFQAEPTHTDVPHTLGNKNRAGTHLRVPAVYEEYEIVLIKHSKATSSKIVHFFTIL
jgi:hypothetical protein